MVQRSKNLDNMSPLEPVVGDEEPADTGDARLNQRDRDADYGNRNDGYSSREMTNADWEKANAPTDPESRRRFRERFSQTHLPDLPKKEGWHRYWASSTHATNTPARLQTLGYKVITLEQLAAEGAGWSPEAASAKDAASVDGAVRWREMVALECPEELYQQWMKEWHHDLPRDMQRDIFEPLQEIGERVAGRGGVNFTEDFQAVQRFRRAPRQFE
jgi:hypothetical protein